MKLQYNYTQDESQIVYYILGNLIFISIFFISIKLLFVSLIFSMVLYIILNLVSCIYIFNINRYSVFKYDILWFNVVFYIFGIIYIFNANIYIYKCNNTWYISLCSIIILLSLINYLLIILKISHAKMINNLRIPFIISSFCFICITLIFCFSWVYSINTNYSITSYVNANFKVDGDFYSFLNLEAGMDNYLSYNTKTSYKPINIFYKNNLSNNDLNVFINTTFKPVDKFEDYLLFSTQSLGGCCGFIQVYGVKLKYILIIQKIMFYITFMITLVSLIDIYKLKENI